MRATCLQLFRTILLMGTLTVLSGCSVAFNFGTPPRIDQLKLLRPGISNSTEIRRILGEPRGNGETYLSIGHRTIWFYDSGQVDRDRTQIRYLLVFLDGETYDGYLWFDLENEYDEADAS